MNENELKHFGILKQKWGVRHGPPYPLAYEDHSTAQLRAAKKDQKWAHKNENKITKKAYKKSEKDLNAYNKKVLIPQYQNRTIGKQKYIFEYNKKMAELMSQKVSDLRSPSGQVVSFVAKRGELGVYMALSTYGYDMNQLKNGVWNSGRIGYRKKVLEKL